MLSQSRSAFETSRSVTIAAFLLLAVLAVSAQTSAQLGLRVTVDEKTGLYAIALQDARTPALQAGVAAKIDGTWLRASDYPRHAVEQSQGEGSLGKANVWQVTYSGLEGQPELVCRIRAYESLPFGEIQVTVRNSSSKPIHVQAIRSVDTTTAPVISLGGSLADVRVLSDSFSEDRPQVAIHDLADAPGGVHRGVGSQLIYDRRTHQSLFLGALSSDKFLTILRLRMATGNESRISAYEVDSTGTTEMVKENSLRHSPPEDQIELSLPVAPGDELSGESILFSLDTDYHRQLETYGSLVRKLHHARVSGPSLMGWWSWTAYYFGLNEGTALTNARWESEHLKSLGYNIFHIDEGYQFARGEYSTPNATLFPNGLASLYYKVHGLGLAPAIWTAPFEVSERSWIYQNHPDWLVKNAQGKPIRAGYVTNNKDQLYALDTTNPGAQDYLRKTYSTLVNDWGIRCIKMDFMEDSAVEGYFFKPNTTALEAQRIGLKIIRDTVGDSVYLDKDGSPMLNPVGYVDYGRTSQDTGHTFGASKDAATGIAARYYMHRNFYVTDPDAFTVSTQTVSDHPWHGGTRPESPDEARVSIVLSAISGGMFEIGDDLPTLQKEPDRLALIQNQDLIDMIRLGQASRPVDLMDYSPEDGQPSIFLLKEDARQSIVTVFNWTDNPRQRSLDMAAIGLSPSGEYKVTDVLEPSGTVDIGGSRLRFSQQPHSVRALKFINSQIAPEPPAVTLKAPESANVGVAVDFQAESSGEPVLSFRWDFGDGVTQEESQVQHAYTEPGIYNVVLKVTALNGLTVERTAKLNIIGQIPKTFEPQLNRRYKQP